MNALREGWWLVGCAAILTALSALVFGCGVKQPAPSVVLAITSVPSAPSSAEPAAATPTASRTPTVIPPTATPPAPTSTPLPTATPEPTAVVPEERPELVHGDLTLPLVSLTFDIGGNDDYVDQVLDILRAKHVRSTFFIVGQWADDYPDHVRQIVADGHELGNHSYAHPDYRDLADDDIVADLARAEETLSAFAGRGIRPLFRFPSGARDDRTETVVNDEGYRSIYWTVESGDWRPEMTGDDVYRRVMGAVDRGSIIVMHANSGSAAASLPSIIDSLHARGFGILKVSSLPE